MAVLQASSGDHCGLCPGASLGEALVRSRVSRHGLRGQRCSGQDGGVVGWLQNVLEPEKLVWLASPTCQQE